MKSETTGDILVMILHESTLFSCCLGPKNGKSKGSRHSEDDNALRVLICGLVDPDMEDERQINAVTTFVPILYSAAF